MVSFSQRAVQHFQWPAHLLKRTTVPTVVSDQVRKYRYEPLIFEGVKIYLRPDLFKLTPDNMEKLKMGFAPIGIDNKTINLHHLTQTNDGPLAMMLNSVHQQREVSIKQISAAKLPLQKLLTLQAPLEITDNGVKTKKITAIIHNIFPKINKKFTKAVAAFFKEQQQLKSRSLPEDTQSHLLPVITRIGTHPQKFHHQSVHRPAFNEFKQRFWEYIYAELSGNTASALFPDTNLVIRKVKSSHLDGPDMFKQSVT
jgi:hypothetical protein